MRPRSTCATSAPESTTARSTHGREGVQVKCARHPVPVDRTRDEEAEGALAWIVGDLVLRLLLTEEAHERIEHRGERADGRPCNAYGDRNEPESTERDASKTERIDKEVGRIDEHRHRSVRFIFSVRSAKRNFLGAVDLRSLQVVVVIDGRTPDDLQRGAACDPDTKNNVG